ncbi:Hypothetical predicted protein [Lecanosticta acicola]|uniref:F-box domain-containing protein n=1 Tax=Lecanosticta acicola TaxID=111012 RepID=A0AAI8YZ04_9PEZI|nr:Hypothetical predicted protein [Lecanosticta acicola]
MEESRIGRLPPELRNLVYEYSLSEPDGVEIWREPGLLRTCKAIRAEAELMFYVNDFSVDVHEDRMSHALCKWLKSKSETRLKLIRSLSVHCHMPSMSEKEVPAGAEEEDDSAGILALLQLMHLMDSMRRAFLSRPLEEVIKFTLNGANDSEPFDRIDNMTAEDQDRYRSAKFLIMCLVHGEQETLEAAEESGSREQLVKLDEVIQRRRRQSNRSAVERSMIV